MKKLNRFHKVAFTGLMSKDKDGCWVKWHEVCDLVYACKKDEIDLNIEYIAKREAYRKRCAYIGKISVLLNVLLLAALVGV